MEAELAHNLQAGGLEGLEITSQHSALGVCHIPAGSGQPLPDWETQFSRGHRLQQNS